LTKNAASVQHDPERNSGIFVRTAVDRIFDVVNVLAAAPGGLALADVSRQARLARPTTHRLLADLGKRGLVRSAAPGQYALTLDIVMLGFEHLARLGFLDLCQPYLDALAAQCGELVRVAWRDGDRLVFVAEAQGAGPGLRYDANLGRAAVLHAMAVGKCFLASLPAERAERLVERQGLLGSATLGSRALKTTAALRLELARVRRQGYAISIDEGDTGAASVSVPITSAGREYLGSLVIVAPSARVDRRRLVEWVPKLRATAERIARVAPLERFCRRSETSVRRRLGR
jgi:IclR family transcriptional regulator, acetate operon repressor